MLPTGKSKISGFIPLETAVKQERNKMSLTGFTLAELLLSVVILSFGLVGVIGSYLTAANALDSGQNRLRAVELLQGKLTALQKDVIEGDGLSPASSSEEIMLYNRPATYSLEIASDVTDGELDLSKELNSVKLSLAWKERNIEKDVSVFTYLENKTQQ